MKKTVLFFVVMLVVLFSAQAEVQVPKFQGTYINDYGSLLTSHEEGSLNQMLRAYEDSTSNQLIVLTLSSTEYESEGTLFDYSHKVFGTWGIGQKNKNNGVLIVLVKNPNSSNTPSVRIVTGYGLEGALPDISCKRIIRSIRPMINEGQYYEGLNKALAGITERIGSEFSADKESKGLADWQIIALVLLAATIIVALISYVLRKTSRENQGYNSSDFNYSGQNDDDSSTRYTAAYMSSSDSLSDYSGGGYDGGGDSGGCDCGGGGDGGGGGGD